MYSRGVRIPRYRATDPRKNRIESQASIALVALIGNLVGRNAWCGIWVAQSTHNHSAPWSHSLPSTVSANCASGMASMPSVPTVTLVRNRSHRPYTAGSRCWWTITGWSPRLSSPDFPWYTCTTSRCSRSRRRGGWSWLLSRRCQTYLNGWSSCHVQAQWDL